jgi:hypothetical protein
MPTRTDEHLYARGAPSGAESDFYKIDGTKLSFAEIRRMAPGYFALLIASAAKILRRPLRARFGCAYERVRIIELADAPPHLAEELAAALAQCESQGFVRRFAVSAPCVGDQQGASVVLANRDRTVLASAAYARAGTLKEVIIGLISKLADGRIVSTTGAGQRLEPPPGFLASYRAGATVAELVAWHTQLLAHLKAVRALVLDDVAQRQLLLDNSQRIFDFHRARGVLVPMTSAEVERLRAQAAGPLA